MLKNNHLSIIHIAMQYAIKLTGKCALKADTWMRYVLLRISSFTFPGDFNLYLKTTLGSRGSSVLAVGMNTNE